MTDDRTRSPALRRAVAWLAVPALALLAWAAPQYRSDRPWLGPWSAAYAAAGLAAPLLAVAVLAWSTRTRRRGAAWAVSAAAAVLLACGWLQPEPRAAAAALLLGLMGATWGSALHLHHDRSLLTGLTAGLVGLAIFLTEAPVLLREPAFVHWGSADCFRQPLFPKTPPYLPAGGRLLPDLDARMPAPEYPLGARIVTNALGLRTRHAVTPGAEPARTRVLVLGDSFANGFAADQDAFFAPLLERELDDGAEVLPVEVSDPAYGLRHLQDHIAALRPDRVLYAQCGNDVMQAGWYAGAGGPFRLHADGVLRDDGPRRPDADFYAAHDHLKARHPGDPARTAPRREDLPRRLTRLRLVHLLLRDDAGPAVPTRGFAPTPDGRLRLLDGAANAGLYLWDEPEEIAALRRITADLYAAMDSTCRAAGADFAVVLFPQRHQVQPRDWAALREAWNLDDDAFDLDLPQRAMTALCAARGVRVLDLLPDFRAAADSVPQLYLPGGDVHFNRRGHAVAAAATARRLRAP
ncbi:MAG TPA: hypothetical protein PLH84_16225 [Candidatus Krumholzibacteria bacterium]|nr:hypothetical protein [Candidatus Krumholzibacteria bacterium]